MSDRTLEEITRELGPDELRVLKKIAERLAMGQKQYGRLRLAHDARDFRKEAIEELLDAVVYLTCQVER